MNELAQQLPTLLTKVQKPAQYLGNEMNVIKKDFDAASVRICLIFPDKYEMGMSHVGLKILYEILNRIPDVVCERAYAPEVDMEALLREHKLPYFSLESKRPLGDFDLIGFSFTYELTYTNFLNILDLSKIPVWQKDRRDGHPIIIGGGGAMMNAEPIAPFLDAAVLGDGEEVILDFVNAIRTAKETKKSRDQLLDDCTQIEGVYVPSFFEPEYHEDGTIKQIKALKEGYTKIKKRIVSQLDKQVFPVKPLVPVVKLIHDRIGIEIQRGCNRACRFCQAGYIDRPVRQRSPETILNIAEESLKNTGIDDISLLSLSAADYAPIVPLLKELNTRYANDKIAISVPATRTEKLSPELIEQIKKVRKTGFTVAPEAGSPRMRRVINKGNQTEDLFAAVTNAFSSGWDLLKLYYMVGLPFELDEDVIGIANEGNDCIKICFKYSQRSELNLSVSSFVPKPHTPFQWEPQMTIEETKRKHGLVRQNLKNKRIRFKHHDPSMSYLEGLMSRGDRKIAGLIYQAFANGCRFDEWQEHFSFDRWLKAIEQSGIDPDFYLHRRRTLSEILPWEHLFAQMDKNWLWKEFEQAEAAAKEGLNEEQSALLHCLREHQQAKKALKPLDGQLPGFTEDCSLQRCSYCGVCDFKNIKNKIYVIGDEEIVAKKGNREWYGWTQPVRTGQIKESQSQPMDNLPPVTLRLRYSKEEWATLWGHLEIMGLLKRAFRRLALPVAYSQGFHPHMKVTSSPPLTIGIKSAWEFIDVELKHWIDPQIVKDKLNESLPDGLKILDASFIDSQAPSLYSSVASIVYKAAPQNGAWSNELIKHLEYRLKNNELIHKKETAKGFKEVNIKDFVTFDIKPSDVTLKIRFDSNGSVKPVTALKVLLEPHQIDSMNLRWEKIEVNRV